MTAIPKEMLPANLIQEYLEAANTFFWDRIFGQNTPGCSLCSAFESFALSESASSSELIPALASDLDAYADFSARFLILAEQEVMNIEQMVQEGEFYQGVHVDLFLHAMHLLAEFGALAIDLDLEPGSHWQIGPAYLTVQGKHVNLGFRGGESSDNLKDGPTGTAKDAIFKHLSVHGTNTLWLLHERGYDPLTRTLQNNFFVLLKNAFKEPEGGLIDGFLLLPVKHQTASEYIAVLLKYHKLLTMVEMAEAGQMLEPDQLRMPCRHIEKTSTERLQ